jgi:RNA polymerase sigma factor (sigma-70 family)
MVAGKNRTPGKGPSSTPHPADGLSGEEAALYRSIPCDVQYVAHESFDTPASHDGLLAEDDICGHPPTWRYRLDVPDNSPAAHGKVFRLSRDEERKLFLQYNYARYRLANLQTTPPADRTTDQIRDMLLWYRRALHLRAVLARANLALVLTMVKRFATGHVELCELVSEGNLVLLRCLESFDVSRGFKFSTYACRAIAKGFSRLTAKAGRYRKHFPVEFDPELERSDYADRRQHSQRSSYLEALREVLADNRAGLGDLERTIVLERFGITSSGKRKTLAEVARIVGLCAERVRQIQRLALQKLRRALEDECVPA